MSDLSVDGLRELVEAKLTAEMKYIEAKFGNIDSKFDERNQRYEDRFQAQLTALQKVELQRDADRAQSNEWRGALNDSNVRLASRESVDVLAEKINEISAQLRAQQGQREGSGATRGQIMAGIGLVAVLLGIVGSVVAFL